MKSNTTKNNKKNSQPKSSNISQLKMIWPLMVPYKKYIFLALVLLLLGAAANLSLPVAFKMMIDLGFSSEHQDQLTQYFLLVFVVASLMVLFTSLRYYWVSWVGQRVVTDLRKKVYTQVMRQSPEFFERTKTGEILSRINTDTTLVETVVGSTFSITLRSIVTFIGASIMMIVSSPKLAGMIAIMLPIIVVPIALTGRKIQKLSRIEQDRIADSSALATETINGITVVQAYAQETKENNKFYSAINKAFEASIASRKMVAIMSLLVGFIVFSSIVFVLWLGAKDVITGKMTAGTLSQFVMYAIMAATTTGALSNVWGELKKASGALERITELMHTEPDIVNSVNPIALTKPKGALLFDNVTFAYPSRLDVNVLCDISLNIKAGETVALVGPSGAGKSTLFQLLMRFYEPQLGSITFDGINIQQLDLSVLRSQFSLVAQDVTIFSTTAADNIAYGFTDKVDESIVLNAAHVAHADEFIQQLKQQYQTYLGERGVRLSGGQAQRLSIARAIATEPSVLLLDEATSALDAENERLVQDALNEIMKDRTTLVIAHRLATIRKADRIVVMDKGHIVAQGKHSELLKNSPLYAKLAKLQFTNEL